MTEIVKPGVVELDLKELTKEQLIDQVYRLQRMLETSSDRELRERLAWMEREWIIQGSVLDKICEFLHRRGYKTPDMPSIAAAVSKALYDLEQRAKTKEGE